MDESTLENKSDNNIKQALAELEPKWVHFDKLEVFQWAWEFLKRNSDYIQGIVDLEKEAQRQIREHSDLLDKKSKNKILKDVSSPLFEEPITIKTHKAEEIAIKFGLTVLLSPECQMPKDLYWAYGLVGKAHSDLRLERVLNKKKRTIEKLELFSDEDVLIINYNTPYQAYIDEIIKRYEKRGQTEKLPQFLIEKYPDYLKTYDLRTWGEQKGRMVKKQGEYKSCISWDCIGKYLYEQNLSKAKDKKRIRQLSTQGIRSQYESAESLINGGYKKLLQYKSHIKT